MFSVFGAIRKAAFGRLGRAAAAVAAASWLAACDPAAVGGGGPSIEPGAPVQVALLVPRSSGIGGDDILSRDLENAARLAIADLQGARIDLRVYDTGASPQQAAAAATTAVNDGAKIILGPLRADAANAAGLAVAGRNVNVLSFSNNADIAGGNVYVLGTTFQTVADRLVSYAARRGKGRIYAVYEQTASGEVGRRAIEQAVARSNASLAGLQSYPFSQQGVTAAVPAIVSGVRGSGAQTLFLTAGSVDSLPLLAQLLPGAGLGPGTVQWMGLTRWDIPPATLSLPGVQGGWFALPDPGPNQAFRARYRAAYGADPNPVAGLAYDGIAAIGALVRSGRSDALSSSALTQSSGFVGVNGIFRFRSDGTSERALAIAEIRNNQVVVIDPAPRRFGGAGF
jgi:hypothetical protein